MAWLIENPDQTDGATPFALTDQNGTVQRYVEPVPGLDLSAHLGQLVRVRDDTGLTLLASQLDLPGARHDPRWGGVPPRTARLANGQASAVSPMLPLRPMLPRNRVEQAQYVEQAQHVDHDDSTVELLPEEAPMPNGSGGVPQLQAIDADIPYGGYGGPMMPGGPYEPGCDAAGCGPMPYDFGNVSPYGEPMAGPCPQCGGYHDGYSEGSGCPAAEEASRTHFYGDVEFNFLRPRINGDAVGELSESYQFSPRFVIGVHDIGAMDLRARYWHYGRDTDLLSTSGDIRLEFDVADIEVLHRFSGRRSDILLAAGIRFANLRLEDTAGANSASDMIGLTMAADGLTICKRYSHGYRGWVYGGRISLLGGDWGGDTGSAFIGHHVADDNVMVTELYAGAEVSGQLGNVNLQARAVFEIQNWQSDALANNAGADSISLLGPGLQVGAEF